MQVTSDLTRDESDELYRVMVCYGKPSCALALLLLWDRSWSSSAKRFALHTLQRMWNRGIDILRDGPAYNPGGFATEPD